MRRAASLLALMIVAAAFALAVLTPARAEIGVKVETRHEAGYGRLIFTFDKLPAYRNELASGVLVLSFDAPVAIDLSELADKMPDYVVIARRDPDGRALRMALSRSFVVNVMEAGNQVYVDLLPPEWRGAPPDLPVDVVLELARKAAEAEEKAREEARQRELASKTVKLDVRLARHPTFTRIVFDWSEFVTVQLARGAGAVMLAFNKKAQADLSRLKVDAPPFLRGAESRQTGGGMEIKLRIDEDVDVRGFREDNSYVIDLTGPDTAVAEAVEPVAEAVRAAAAEAQAGAAGPEAETAGQPETVRLPAAQGEPVTVLSGKAEAGGTLESGDAYLDALDDEPAGAPEAALPKPPQAEPAEPEIVPAPPGVAARPEPPETAPSAASVTPARDGNAIRVEGRGQNLKLIFPFPEPVPAAVFRRGTVLWVVLDSEARLDPDALRRTEGDVISDVVHARVGAMQYFRIRLTQPWLVYAAQSHGDWVISVGNMVTGAAQPLHLERSLRADKRSVMKIQAEGAARVHWIADSDLGDQLAVLTVNGPPRNVAKTQDFVEFEALATAQGVVVRAKSDDIAVRLALDELIVTRREGLTLSAGDAGQYVAGKRPLAAMARPPGFLDIASWREPEPSRLSEYLFEMQRKAAMGPEDELARRRYELARAYFANGLAAEAAGITRRMLHDDVSVEADPAFNALRGAALATMHRTEEARRELSVHALANDPHAALWRGMIAVQEREWEQALDAFDDGTDVVADYPPDIQARFRLLAARAALELNKLMRAAAELDAMPDVELPGGAQAEAQLLKGRYLDRVGHVEEALSTYNGVLSGNHRPSVAEAELARISLMLRTDRMKRPEAIEALERLQLVWRGDDIELNTLRMLADLYVKEERYREAFDVMKNALLAFPDAKIALRIQDDMRLVFQDLFLHGGSKTMRPVDALGLYYEFREMTPVGRLGDEMIRHLADRLISVDLLDQAAALLGHQVENRLSGAARAQVATRLAMVYLLNRKSELALRTIRRTRQTGLPQALQHSRTLLEARALAELGRADAAIEILNTLEGPEVERLKADALWLAQQWGRAGEQLEKLLGMRWQEQGPLSERERFDVLRAGICYSLASDQFALDRLRQKFHEKMQQTSDAQSFSLITQPIKASDGEGDALRKLARDIAAVDTLDAFMKVYRERYDQEPARKSDVGDSGKSG